MREKEIPPTRTSSNPIQALQHRKEGGEREREETCATACVGVCLPVALRCEYCSILLASQCMHAPTFALQRSAMDSLLSPSPPLSLLPLTSMACTYVRAGVCVCERERRRGRCNRLLSLFSPLLICSASSRALESFGHAACQACQLTSLARRFFGASTLSLARVGYLG